MDENNPVSGLKKVFRVIFHVSVLFFRKIIFFHHSKEGKMTAFLKDWTRGKRTKKWKKQGIRLVIMAM